MLLGVYRYIEEHYREGSLSELAEELHRKVTTEELMEETGIFNQGSELTENIKWIGQGFPARLLLSEGMCCFEAYRCLTLHMGN